MGEENGWVGSPSGAPLFTQRDEHWRQFDNSVNAVSFGFVATAILISMFLVMAIFERFLRPAPPVLTRPGVRLRGHDMEAQIAFNGKVLGHPSPKMSINTREVSVLMPGEDVPTFIAQPAPILPCPPERVPWPPHEHKSVPRLSPNPSSSSI